MCAGGPAPTGPTPSAPWPTPPTAPPWPDRRRAGGRRSDVDVVQLGGVVLEDPALDGGLQLADGTPDALDAVRVEARGVRDVRLEHDAVGAQVVDGRRQRGALEPEAAVELAAEVLRWLHGEVRQVLR